MRLPSLEAGLPRNWRTPEALPRVLHESGFGTPIALEALYVSKRLGRLQGDSRRDPTPRRHALLHAARSEGVHVKVGTGLTSSAMRRLTTAIVTVGVAIALPAGAYAAPVRVVIDPGHGGKDPGAMSKGVVEKKTNLKISRAVAKEARRQGWDVKMTRKTDKFVALEKRPAKANSSRADVFVSIHSNSTGKAALGNMTIYRTKQGKRLGRAIMSELKPMTSYKDIGNRRDVRGLAVLRASKRPAVIVEVLSVTASRERKQLKSEKAQKKYARAIVRGIDPGWLRESSAVAELVRHPREDLFR